MIIKKAKRVRHKTVYEQLRCPNCQSGSWCHLRNHKFDKRTKIVVKE